MILPSINVGVCDLSSGWWCDPGASMVANFCVGLYSSVQSPIVQYQNNILTFHFSPLLFNIPAPTQFDPTQPITIRFSIPFLKLLWGKRLLLNWRMMLFWRARCIRSINTWMLNCFKLGWSILNGTHNYVLLPIASCADRSFGTFKSHPNTSIRNSSKMPAAKKMRPRKSKYGNKKSVTKNHIPHLGGSTVGGLIGCHFIVVIIELVTSSYGYWSGTDGFAQLAGPGVCIHYRCTPCWIRLASIDLTLWGLIKQWVKRQTGIFFYFYNCDTGVCFVYDVAFHWLSHKVKDEFMTIAKSLSFSTTLNVNYGEFRTSTVLTKNLVPTCRP